MKYLKIGLIVTFSVLMVSALTFLIIPTETMLEAVGMEEVDDGVYGSSEQPLEIDLNNDSAVYTQKLSSEDDLFDVIVNYELKNDNTMTVKWVLAGKLIDTCIIEKTSDYKYIADDDCMGRTGIATNVLNAELDKIDFSLLEKWYIKLIIRLKV